MDAYDATVGPGSVGGGAAARVSRRWFLTRGGTALGGALLAGTWRVDAVEGFVAQVTLPPGADVVVLPELPGTPVRQGPKPTRTVVLRRREDQLRLVFDLYNLDVVDAATGPELRRQGRATPIVVVAFPPQHVLEQAFYEYDSDMQDGQPPLPSVPSQPVTPAPTATEQLSSPPVGARLSGPTRLAFEVAGDLLPIPFTAAGLLDWSSWRPRLVPAARPPGPVRSGVREPGLQEPAHDQTAIELPLFLQLSPHERTGWVHAPDAVTHGSHTELWHSRLASRPDSAADPDEDDDELRVVRAIWTRDPDFKQWLATGGNSNFQGGDGESFPLIAGYGMPFRASLAPKDRYDLVVSTSDFRHRVSRSNYLPTPVEVERLHLTSLGGWLDAAGFWKAGVNATDQSGTSLESWRHKATLGRDHYVRVVRRGYLAGFGHGAALIKVSERKFHNLFSLFGPARRIAFLRQRYFIVVRQPVRTYGAFDPVDGRDLPFGTVRLTTLVTPNLDPPDGPEVGSLQNTEAFVPTVGGKPFPFQYLAVDQAGRQVAGTTPLVFVDAVKAYDANDMQALRSWYQNTAPDGSRTTDLAGQAVALAPSVEPGDTQLECHVLRWGMKAPTGSLTALGNADQPLFLPTMDRVGVRLQAVEAALGGPLAGAGGLGDGSTNVVYNAAYVSSGFTGNPGEVFVELEDTNNPIHLDFGANTSGDRAGGVAAPNLAITAVSRVRGPVGGDPDAFRQGSFDPAAFFGGAAATLLGDITLADVIGAVTNFQGNDDRLLKITSTELDSPPRLETVVRWQPDLTPSPPLFTLGSGASLVLDARTVTPLSGGSGSSEVTGDLRDFALHLFGSDPFLSIAFDRLMFRSVDGQKPDVDVRIRDVSFGGALAFVNQLKDYLTFGDSGFKLELLPTHLDASYTLPLPTVAVGAFSLQNMSFLAGVTVPFTGQPVRARFAFCRMDDPFLLTVMVFGGGGFFELGIGADGVESLQAALEFGGSLSLDVGVASGGVELMAGIYLAMGVPTNANPEGDCELTGYVRLKGRLEVLGLITLTLTFKLSLTYIPSQDKAVGKATMVVEISVLVFSGSVEVTVERRFGGSTDPTFGEVLPDPALWAGYCSAFAPA